MAEHLFLSVLGTSLSVSLVILLLTVLTPLIDRRYAAKWKYLAWILLALRLLIPVDPVVTRDFVRTSFSESAEEDEIDSVEKHLPPAAAQPARMSRRIILEIPSGMNEPLARSGDSIRITPITILVSIWLAGIMIFIGVHLVSYLHYRRLLRRDGIRIKKGQMKLLQRVSGELHLRKRISIITYTEADSPMLIGFRQPVLVLPAETYSDEALYYILKHELIHFIRHDVYWKLLFVLANAVHWFNPVVWFMHREAVVDMELSCDERVVSGADRKSKNAYTETLYTTLQRKCNRKQPLSTQFYGGKRIMQKRFRNILRHSVKRNGFSVLVSTAVLMIGAGLLIGCSVSNKDRPSQSKVSSGSTEQTEDSFADSRNTDAGGLVTDGYVGDGYSIYVPDDDWEQYKPDMWRSVHNDKICFWVTCYENRNLETVRNELGEVQALLPVTESGRENEMEGQIGDMITRARLIEQAEADRVWAVFYSYPEEAIEGVGARLPVITDTFSVQRSDSGYMDLWDFDDSAYEAGSNVLVFQNGLQLILPEAWLGKTMLEISASGPSDTKQGTPETVTENRLSVYEKNNAEAHYGGELFHMFYVGKHVNNDFTFDAEQPFCIYGNKAAKNYRVLGVYSQDEQEYALIYAKYPEDGYDENDRNVALDDPELQRDYQDLYALVDDVEIITDRMPGFTKCDVNDLDWLYIEGLSDSN